MLRACWEVMKCGRACEGEPGGDFETCPAYPDHGHSCWIVAGSFCRAYSPAAVCDGQYGCTHCEIYLDYSPSFGTKRSHFRRLHPKEFDDCVKAQARLFDRMMAGTTHRG